jgi:hypothetical protein
MTQILIILSVSVNYFRIKLKIVNKILRSRNKFGMTSNGFETNSASG